MNEAVLEAIDHELRLSNRIEAAKQQAIGAATASVLVWAQNHIHGWNSEKSAGIASLIAAQVNDLFERIDYVKAIRDAAAHAAYRKGLPSIRIDAEKVLNEAEPELKVIMAESALKVVGENVSETIIAVMQKHLKDARHG